MPVRVFFLNLHSMSIPKTTNEVNQSRVSKVQEYISCHYREELTLSELAGVANMAPTSLSHLFKKVTGGCLSDYIIAVRIQNAKELLQNSDHTIKAIAYDCGFSTLTNFNRQFKRLTGCTPTELRESNKTR